MHHQGCMLGANTIQKNDVFYLTHESATSYLNKVSLVLKIKKLQFILKMGQPISSFLIVAGCISWFFRKNVSQ